MHESRICKMKRIAVFLALTALAAVIALCSCSGRPADKDPGTDSAQEDKQDNVLPDTGAPDTDGQQDTGTGTEEQNVSGAKEFTAKVTLEDEWVEFCLPEDHDGMVFTDMGANCVLYVDRYSNPVSAYYEYDDQGETVKKTVGKYTYDYQKFNYLGIEDWRIYVIMIAFTDDPNQMSHEYYRFLYTVFAKEYDDAQVEKFMDTIRFLGEE